MRSKSPELMKQIQDFAEQYYLNEGRSPSTSDIANGVGIARGTAYKYLVAMNDKGLISYDGRDIRTKLTEKFESTRSKAPICGSIPCGSPTEEIEHIETIVSLPTAIFGKGELYILVASGDSMIGAGIEDGDLVVINKQAEANEGDIVVALIDNESTLKRFYKDDEHRRVILRAENKKYKDIIRPSCTIQGVAQHVIKRV